MAPFGFEDDRVDEAVARAALTPASAARHYACENYDIAVYPLTASSFVIDTVNGNKTVASETVYSHSNSQLQGSWLQVSMPDGRILGTFTDKISPDCDEAEFLDFANHALGWVRQCQEMLDQAPAQFKKENPDVIHRLIRWIGCVGVDHLRAREKPSLTEDAKASASDSSLMTVTTLSMALH